MRRERPADLLVGRDRDAREPGSRGQLGRGEQEAGLADPRLALEGDRRQATLGVAHLLGDRVELGAPADDRTRRAAQLDGERQCGPTSGSSAPPSAPSDRRARAHRGRVAQHAEDYGLTPPIRMAGPTEHGCGVEGQAGGRFAAGDARPPVVIAWSNTPEMATVIVIARSPFLMSSSDVGPDPPAAK